MIERSGTKQNVEYSTFQRCITIPEGGVNATCIPQNLHLGFDVVVAGYMFSDGEKSCDACIDGVQGLQWRSVAHVIILFVSIAMTTSSMVRLSIIMSWLD